ncbi:hypothetical protein D3C86_1973850 [compost metagenome]
MLPGRGVFRQSGRVNNHRQILTNGHRQPFFAFFFWGDPFKSDALEFLLQQRGIRLQHKTHALNRTGLYPHHGLRHNKPDGFIAFR